MKKSQKKRLMREMSDEELSEIIYKLLLYNEDSGWIS